MFANWLSQYSTSLTCAWSEYDAAGNHVTLANLGTAKFQDSNSTKVSLQWAMKLCANWNILLVLTSFGKTAENNMAKTRVIVDFDAVYCGIWISTFRWDICLSSSGLSSQQLTIIMLLSTAFRNHSNRFTIANQSINQSNAQFPAWDIYMLWYIC